eukprot:scaffold34685_cov183-Amphora_coffeaeformis.AAC.42
MGKALSRTVAQNHGGTWDEMRTAARMRRVWILWCPIDDQNTIKLYMKVAVTYFLEIGSLFLSRVLTYFGCVGCLHDGHGSDDLQLMTVSPVVVVTSSRSIVIYQ